MIAARLSFPSQYFIGPGILEKGLKAVPSLGNRTVIITGKRWAIESGTLDKVMKILSENGVESHHIPGISPNPDHTEIDKMAEMVREIDPDFLTGLGGGSVLDATKAISIAARMERKIWDLIIERPRKVNVYPVVAISTIAASGSDFDGAAVVNNRSLKAKLPIGYPELIPKISVIDVELHTTISPYYTAVGCVDIFCQFYEPYIMGQGHFEYSEIMALEGMKRVIEVCPLVIENPDDVNLRGELAYLASISMSGLARVGRDGKFSMHWLEHVLSGHYPEIPHAQGLATLLPHYTKFFIERRPEVFERVAKTLSDSIENLVPFIENWLEKIGVRKSLRELGVTESSLEPMAHDVIKYYGWEEGRVSAPIPMDFNDVLEIYRMAY